VSSMCVKVASTNVAHFWVFMLVHSREAFELQVLSEYSFDDQMNTRISLFMSKIPIF